MMLGKLALGKGLATPTRVGGQLALALLLAFCKDGLKLRDHALLRSKLANILDASPCYVEYELL